jgi:hypothetical protein
MVAPVMARSALPPSPLSTPAICGASQERTDRLWRPLKPRLVRTIEPTVGISFLAPGGEDAMLVSIGRAFHTDTKSPLGALGLSRRAAT